MTQQAREWARLKYLDDGRVLYTGNFNPSLRTDHRLVNGLEFLASLVPHVALRYEARIHTFGAISTRIRAQLGWIKRKERPEGAKGRQSEITVTEEEPDSKFIKLRKKRWAELIRKLWHEDPSLCRSCGHAMRIISFITYPRQEEVVLALLGFEFDLTVGD